VDPLLGRDRRRKEIDCMTDGRSLVLLGGGGHAAVVAEAARSAGWTLFGYLDDARHTEAEKHLGLQRLGAISDIDRIPTAALAHAAIGDARLRRQWLDALGDRAAPAIVHETAVVSPSASLAPGSFVGPRAVVNAGAVVGRGVIVNTAAIVEHDCVLEAFCHVAPGAAMGGAAVAGEQSTIGLNASVLPGVRIGASATLGAGAVAVTDLPDGATGVGIPAR
jgi:acetyltransferase EpsM